MCDAPPKRAVSLVSYRIKSSNRVSVGIFSISFTVLKIYVFKVGWFLKKLIAYAKIMMWSVAQCEHFFCQPYINYFLITDHIDYSLVSDINILQGKIFTFEINPSGNNNTTSVLEIKVEKTKANMRHIWYVPLWMSHICIFSSCLFIMQVWNRNFPVKWSIFDGF